jgi:hypothetical protein
MADKRHVPTLLRIAPGLMVLLSLAVIRKPAGRLLSCSETVQSSPLLDPAGGVGVRAGMNRASGTQLGSH